jgi:hypothetical protein
MFCLVEFIYSFMGVYKFCFISHIIWLKTWKHLRSMYVSSLSQLVVDSCLKSSISISYSVCLKFLCESNEKIRKISRCDSNKFIFGVTCGLALCEAFTTRKQTVSLKYCQHFMNIKKKWGIKSWKTDRN